MCLVLVGYRLSFSRRNVCPAPILVYLANPARARLQKQNKTKKALRGNINVRCLRATARWRTDTFRALVSSIHQGSLRARRNQAYFGLVFSGSPWGGAGVIPHPFQRGHVWLLVLLGWSSYRSMGEPRWRAGWPTPGAGDLARLCVNVRCELAATWSPK